MTPTLRKYHRRIWLTLAFILPVMFVAAVLSIPKQAITTAQSSVLPQALKNIVETVDSDLAIVHLRNNGTDANQLEIILKSPLTVPEGLVYVSCNSEDRILVGKLTSGIHRFALGATDIKGCTVFFHNPFDNTDFDIIRL